MRKTNKFLKVVSSLLVYTFICEQLAFANPDLSAIKLDLFAKPKVDLGIPESVATVEDAFVGTGSPKTIYLIQDAHTNTSGQFNVAKTLDLLFQKNKQLKYVFLEAGQGDESLSFLRQYASLEKRKQASEAFLRQGKLQGSEYFDLISDKHLVLWGVENLKLYAQSVEAYKEVANNREKFEDYLKKIDVTVDTLKPRILNPALMAFDAKYQKFAKQEISLTDYFAILDEQATHLQISLEKYPHFQKLSKLKKLEEEIDFQKANEEQVKAIQSLDAKTQAELLEASKDNSALRLKGENKENRAFHALLEERLKGLQASCPELNKYFNYLKEANKIEPRQILQEQKDLEKEILGALIVTADEESLLKASRNLETLKKLLKLTLTPEEWDEYQKNKTSFDVTRMTGFLNKKIMDFETYYERALFLEEGYEPIVQKAEEFYSLTYQRDQEFIQNLQTKMDTEGQKEAVLITGGFHSPNLKSLLKQKNISFVNLTPQVLQETNQKRYEEILLGQVESLEKSFVSQNRMSPSRGIATHMDPIRVPAERAVFAVGLGIKSDSTVLKILGDRQQRLAAGLLGFSGARLSSSLSDSLVEFVKLNGFEAVLNAFLETIPSTPEMTFPTVRFLKVSSAETPGKIDFSYSLGDPLFTEALRGNKPFSFNKEFNLRTAEGLKRFFKEINRKPDDFYSWLIGHRYEGVFDTGFIAALINQAKSEEKLNVRAGKGVEKNSVLYFDGKKNQKNPRFDISDPDELLRLMMATGVTFEDLEVQRAIHYDRSSGEPNNAAEEGWDDWNFSSPNSPVYRGSPEVAAPLIGARLGVIQDAQEDITRALGRRVRIAAASNFMASAEFAVEHTSDFIFKRNLVELVRTAKDARLELVVLPRDLTHNVDYYANHVEVPVQYVANKRVAVKNIVFYAEEDTGSKVISVETKVGSFVVPNRVSTWEDNGTLLVNIGSSKSPKKLEEIEKVLIKVLLVDTKSSRKDGARLSKTSDLTEPLAVWGQLMGNPEFTKEYQIVQEGGTLVLKTKSGKTLSQKGIADLGTHSAWEEFLKPTLGARLADKFGLQWHDLQGMGGLTLVIHLRVIVSNQGDYPKFIVDEARKLIDDLRGTGGTAPNYHIYVERARYLMEAVRLLRVLEAIIPTADSEMAAEMAAGLRNESGDNFATYKIRVVQARDWIGARLARAPKALKDPKASRRKFVAAQRELLVWDTAQTERVLSVLEKIQRSRSKKPSKVDIDVVILALAGDEWMPLTMLDYLHKNRMDLTGITADQRARLITALKNLSPGKARREVLAKLVRPKIKAKTPKRYILDHGDRLIAARLSGAASKLRIALAGEDFDGSGEANFDRGLWLTNTGAQDTLNGIIYSNENFDPKRNVVGHRANLQVVLNGSSLILKWNNQTEYKERLIRNLPTIREILIRVSKENRLVFEDQTQGARLADKQPASQRTAPLPARIEFHDKLPPDLTIGKQVEIKLDSEFGDKFNDLWVRATVEGVEGEKVLFRIASGDDVDATLRGVPVKIYNERTLSTVRPLDVLVTDARSSGEPEKLTWIAEWETLGNWGGVKRELSAIEDKVLQTHLRGKINRLVNILIRNDLFYFAHLDTAIPVVIQRMQADSFHSWEPLIRAITAAESGQDPYHILINGARLAKPRTASRAVRKTSDLTEPLAMWSQLMANPEFTKEYQIVQEGGTLVLKTKSGETLSQKGIADLGTNSAWELFLKPTLGVRSETRKYRLIKRIESVLRLKRNSKIKEPYSASEIEELIKALRPLDGVDWRPSISAADKLGDAKSSKAIEPLMKWLEDGRVYDFQKAVAEALGKIGSAKAVPALIKTFNLRDDRRPQKAYIAALGDIGSIKAAPFLIRVLKSGETEVIRQAAKKALRQIHENLKRRGARLALTSDVIKGAVAAFKEVALSSRYKDRKDRDIIEQNLNRVLRANLSITSRVEVLGQLNSAVNCYRSLSQKPDAGALRRIDDIINQISRAQEAWQVERRAKKAQIRKWMKQIRVVLTDSFVEDIDDDIYLLLEEKKSTQGWSDRESVAHQLADTKSLKVVKALSKSLLNDRVARVRIAAANSLANIGFSEAIPSLIKALKDEDKGVRNQVVQALGAIKSLRVIRSLIPILKDKDIEVVHSVVKALGDLGSPKAVPALIEVLKHENEEIRGEAIKALGNIGSPEAIPALIELHGKDAHSAPIIEKALVRIYNKMDGSAGARLASKFTAVPSMLALTQLRLSETSKMSFTPQGMPEVFVNYAYVEDADRSNFTDLIQAIAPGLISKDQISSIRGAGVLFADDTPDRNLGLGVFSALTFVVDGERYLVTLFKKDDLSKKARLEKITRAYWQFMYDRPELSTQETEPVSVTVAKTEGDWKAGTFRIWPQQKGATAARLAGSQKRMDAIEYSIRRDLEQVGIHHITDFNPDHPTSHVLGVLRDLYPLQSGGVGYALTSGEADSWVRLMNVLRYANQHFKTNEIYMDIHFDAHAVRAWLNGKDHLVVSINSNAAGHFTLDFHPRTDLRKPFLQGRTSLRVDSAGQIHEEIIGARLAEYVSPFVIQPSFDLSNPTQVIASENLQRPPAAASGRRDFILYLVKGDGKFYIRLNKKEGVETGQFIIGLENLGEAFIRRYLFNDDGLNLSILSFSSPENNFIEFIYGDSYDAQQAAVMFKGILDSYHRSIVTPTGTHGQTDGPRDEEGARLSLKNSSEFVVRRNHRSQSSTSLSLPTPNSNSAARLSSSNIHVYTPEQFNSLVQNGLIKRGDIISYGSGGSMFFSDAIFARMALDKDGKRGTVVLILNGSADQRESEIKFREGMMFAASVDLMLKNQKLNARKDVEANRKKVKGSGIFKRKALYVRKTFFPSTVRNIHWGERRFFVQFVESRNNRFKITRESEYHEKYDIYEFIYKISIPPGKIRGIEDIHFLMSLLGDGFHDRRWGFYSNTGPWWRDDEEFIRWFSKIAKKIGTSASSPSPLTSSLGSEATNSGARLASFSKVLITDFLKDNSPLGKNVWIKINNAPTNVSWARHAEDAWMIHGHNGHIGTIPNIGLQPLTSRDVVAIERFWPIEMISDLLKRKPQKLLMVQSGAGKNYLVREDGLFLEVDANDVIQASWGQLQANALTDDFLGQLPQVKAWINGTFGSKKFWRQIAPHLTRLLKFNSLSGSRLAEDKGVEVEQLIAFSPKDQSITINSPLVAPADRTIHLFGDGETTFTLITSEVLAEQLNRWVPGFPKGVRERISFQPNPDLAEGVLILDSSREKGEERIGSLLLWDDLEDLAQDFAAYLNPFLKSRIPQFQENLFQRLFTSGYSRLIRQRFVIGSSVSMGSIWISFLAPSTLCRFVLMPMLENTNNKEAFGFIAYFAGVAIALHLFNRLSDKLAGSKSTKGARLAAGTLSREETKDAKSLAGEIASKTRVQLLGIQKKLKLLQGFDEEKGLTKKQESTTISIRKSAQKIESLSLFALLKEATIRPGQEVLMDTLSTRTGKELQSDPPQFDLKYTATIISVLAEDLLLTGEKRFLRGIRASVEKAVRIVSNLAAYASSAELTTNFKSVRSFKKKQFRIIDLSKYSAARLATLPLTQLRLSETSKMSATPQGMFDVLVKYAYVEDADRSNFAELIQAIAPDLIAKDKTSSIRGAGILFADDTPDQNLGLGAFSALTFLLDGKRYLITLFKKDDLSQKARLEKITRAYWQFMYDRPELSEREADPVSVTVAKTEGDWKAGTFRIWPQQKSVTAARLTGNNSKFIRTFLAALLIGVGGWFLSKSAKQETKSVSLKFNSWSTQAPVFYRYQAQQASSGKVMTRMASIKTSEKIILNASQKLRMMIRANQVNPQNKEEAITLTLIGTDAFGKPLKIYAGYMTFTSKGTYEAVFSLNELGPRVIHVNELLLMGVPVTSADDRSFIPDWIVKDEIVIEEAAVPGGARLAKRNQHFFVIWGSFIALLLLPLIPESSKKLASPAGLVENTNVSIDKIYSAFETISKKEKSLEEREKAVQFLIANIQFSSQRDEIVIQLISSFKDLSMNEIATLEHYVEILVKLRLTKSETEQALRSLEALQSKLAIHSTELTFARANEATLYVATSLLKRVEEAIATLSKKPAGARLGTGQKESLPFTKAQLVRIHSEGVAKLPRKDYIVDLAIDNQPTQIRANSLVTTLEQLQEGALYVIHALHVNHISGQISLGIHSVVAAARLSGSAMRAIYLSLTIMLSGVLQTVADTVQFAFDKGRTSVTVLVNGKPQPRSRLVGANYQPTEPGQHITHYQEGKIRELVAQLLPKNDPTLVALGLGEMGKNDLERMKKTGIYNIHLYQVPLEDKADIDAVKKILRRAHELNKDFYVSVGHWAGLWSQPGSPELSANTYQERMKVVDSVMNMVKLYAEEPWAGKWVVGVENNYYARGGAFAGTKSLPLRIGSEYYDFMVQLAVAIKWQERQLNTAAKPVYHPVVLSNGSLTESQAQIIKEMNEKWAKELNGELPVDAIGGTFYPGINFEGQKVSDNGIAEAFEHFVKLSWEIAGLPLVVVETGPWAQTVNSDEQVRWYGAAKPAFVNTGKFAGIDIFEFINEGGWKSRETGRASEDWFGIYTNEREPKLFARQGAFTGLKWEDGKVLPFEQPAALKPFPTQPVFLRTRTASTQTPAADSSIIQLEGFQTWSGAGAFSTYKDTRVNLTGYKTVRLTFNTTDAGAEFYIRLLDPAGAYDSNSGSMGPFRVPKASDVNQPITMEIGITGGNIKQFSIHTGTVWDNSTHLPKRNLVPIKVEFLKTPPAKKTGGARLSNQDSNMDVASIAKIFFERVLTPENRVKISRFLADHFSSPFSSQPERLSFEHSGYRLVLTSEPSGTEEFPLTVLIEKKIGSFNADEVGAFEAYNFLFHERASGLKTFEKQLLASRDFSKPLKVQFNMMPFAAYIDSKKPDRINFVMEYRRVPTGARLAAPEAYTTQVFKAKGSDFAHKITVTKSPDGVLAIDLQTDSFVGYTLVGHFSSNFERPLEVDPAFLRELSTEFSFDHDILRRIREMMQVIKAQNVEWFAETIKTALETGSIELYPGISHHDAAMAILEQPLFTKNQFIGEHSQSLSHAERTILSRIYQRHGQLGGRRADIATHQAARLATAVSIDELKKTDPEIAAALERRGVKFVYNHRDKNHTVDVLRAMREHGDSPSWLHFLSILDQAATHSGLDAVYFGPTVEKDYFDASLEKYFTPSPKLITLSFTGNTLNFKAQNLEPKKHQILLSLGANSDSLAWQLTRKGYFVTQATDYHYNHPQQYASHSYTDYDYLVTDKAAIAEHARSVDSALSVIQTPEPGVSLRDDSAIVEEISRRTELRFLGFDNFNPPLVHDNGVHQTLNKNEQIIYFDVNFDRSLTEKELKRLKVQLYYEDPQGDGNQWFSEEAIEPLNAEDPHGSYQFSVALHPRVRQYKVRVSWDGGYAWHYFKPQNIQVHYAPSAGARLADSIPSVSRQYSLTAAQADAIKRWLTPYTGQTAPSVHHFVHYFLRDNYGFIIPARDAGILKEEATVEVPNRSIRINDQDGITFVQMSLSGDGRTLTLKALAKEKNSYGKDSNGLLEIFKGYISTTVESELHPVVAARLAAENLDQGDVIYMGGTGPRIVLKNDNLKPVKPTHRIQTLLVDEHHLNTPEWATLDWFESHFETAVRYMPNRFFNGQGEPSIYQTALFQVTEGSYAGIYHGMLISDRDPEMAEILSYEPTQHTLLPFEGRLIQVEKSKVRFFPHKSLMVDNSSTAASRALKRYIDEKTKEWGDKKPSKVKAGWDRVHIEWNDGSSHTWDLTKGGDLESIAYWLKGNLSELDSMRAMIAEAIRNAADFTPENITRRAREVIANVLREKGVSIDQIALDTDLETLGLDSIDHVGMVLDLDEEFEIDIPDAASAEFKTLSDVVRCIQQIKAPEAPAARLAGNESLVEEVRAFDAAALNPTIWDKNTGLAIVKPAQTINEFPEPMRPFLSAATIHDERGNFTPGQLVTSSLQMPSAMNTPGLKEKIFEEATSYANKIRAGVAQSGGQLKYLLWVGMGGSIEDKYAALATGTLKGQVHFFGLDDVDPSTIQEIFDEIVLQEAAEMGIAAIDFTDKQSTAYQTALASGLRKTAVVGQALGKTSVEPIFNIEKALLPQFQAFGLATENHFWKITIPGSLLDLGLLQDKPQNNIPHQWGGQSTSAGRHDYVTYGFLIPYILSGGNPEDWAKGLNLTQEDKVRAFEAADWMFANQQAGRNKVVLAFPEEWQGHFNDDPTWLDPSLWFKQHLEESLGKTPSFILKIVTTLNFSLASSWKKPEDKTDQVVLVVKINGLKNLSDAKIASLRERGYEVHVLDLSSAQEGEALARAMQVFNYAKFRLAMKAGLIGVNQPPVEFYKGIVQWIRGEKNDYPNHEKVKAIFEASGTHVIGQNGFKVSWETLVRSGVLKPEELDHEIASLGLDRNNPADVAGAIYRIALRKIGSGAYGEYMVFGNLNRGHDAKNLRDLLSDPLSSVQRLWREDLHSFADIGKGPGAGHSHHAMNIQGQAIALQVAVKRHAGLQKALGFDTRYSTANSWANNLALAGFSVPPSSSPSDELKLNPEANKGWAVHLEIPEIDEILDLEQFFDRMKQVVSMSEPTATAGARLAGNEIPLRDALKTTFFTAIAMLVSGKKAFALEENNKIRVYNLNRQEDKLLVEVDGGESYTLDISSGAVSQAHQSQIKEAVFNEDLTDKLQTILSTNRGAGSPVIVGSAPAVFLIDLGAFSDKAELENLLRQQDARLDSKSAVAFLGDGEQVKEALTFVSTLRLKKTSQFVGSESLSEDLKDAPHILLTKQGYLTLANINHHRLFQITLQANQSHQAAVFAFGAVQSIMDLVAEGNLEKAFDRFLTLAPQYRGRMSFKDFVDGYLKGKKEVIDQFPLPATVWASFRDAMRLNQLARTVESNA